MRSKPKMDWSCPSCGSTEIEPESEARTTIFCKFCKCRMRIDFERLRMVEVRGKSTGVVR